MAVAAIELILRDKDNPNSVGYLMLLIDFNLALWPPLIMKAFKESKKDTKKGGD